MPKWSSSIFIPFLFLILSVTPNNITAQDKHFSQFYNAPLLLNPALTGGINGKYRIAGIYRQQGRNLYGDPFTTFGAQIDFMAPLNSLLAAVRNNDRAGFGIAFFSDQIPNVDFSTNQMIFSFAYHKELDKNTNQYLSLGYQVGLTQRNINFSNLTFADQFNGLDAFDRVSAETLTQPENNYTYSDMNVGLNYSISPQNDLDFYVGVAYHHFNSPEISFYSNDESPLIQEISTFKLPSKLTVHFATQYQLNRAFYITPRVLYLRQGPSQEIDLGATLKMIFSEHNGSSFNLGLWARGVANDSSLPLNLSSVILQTAVEFDGLQLSLSYDLETQGVTLHNELGTAFEFTLLYTGGAVGDDFIICPTF